MENRSRNRTVSSATNGTGDKKENGVRNRSLTIATDGASDFGGMPRQTNAFQQAIFSPGMLLDSPITPNMNISDVMGMAIQLGAAQNEITHLKGLVDSLTLELSEEKKKNCNKLPHQSNGFSTPRSNVPSTPSSVVSSRSNTVFNSNINGVAIRSQRSERESFEPLSPTPHRTPAGSSRMSSAAGSSTGRRHKRTETPDQHHIRAAMGGQPVFTVGIEPQDDRGLLSDFFDEIKTWASKWTLQAEKLSAETLEALCKHPSMQAFLRNTPDLKFIIAEKNLRCALVAAIVSREIVYNGLCDHFLFNSEHPDADACDGVFNKFSKLGAGHEAEKHLVLLEQQALYTSIKNAGSHRKWRTDTSKKFSGELVGKLGGLIIEHPAAERDHGLVELFIKGYRIGFRMRMDSVKWQMNWPVDGDEFDFNLMVNESRNLCGNTLQTLGMIQKCPQNYAVRFAMSPTIAKSDFSNGPEQKSIVHKALVHLNRKQFHIGAERSLMSSPQGN